MSRRSSEDRLWRNAWIKLCPGLLLVAAGGCGGASSQLTAADLASLATQGTGSSGPPLTNSPIPDSPVSSAPLPSGAYPTTNPGGYYTVSSEHSLLLSAEETPLGFAISNGYFLLFESLTLSGGITRWRVLSTAAQPGTSVASWSVACDLLGDGSHRVGFAADSLYYYLPGSIASDPGNSQYVMRVSQSDCAVASSLDLGMSIQTEPYVLYAPASVYGDSFNLGSAGFSSLTLFSWSLASGSQSQPGLQLNLQPSLGGIGLEYPSSFAFSPGFIWVMDRWNLWKFDPSGNAVAWAALPTPSDGSILNFSAVVAIDSNTLVLVEIVDQEITRYLIDVSHF